MAEETENSISKRARQVKKRAKRAKGFCDFSAIMKDPKYKNAKAVQNNLRRLLGEKQVDMDTLMGLMNEIKENKKFNKAIQSKVNDLEKEGFSEDSVVANNRNPNINETSAKELDAFLELIMENDASVTETTANNFRKAIVNPSFKQYTYINPVTAKERVGLDVDDELYNDTLTAINEGFMHFAEPIMLERLLGQVGKAAPINVIAVTGQSGILKNFAMINLRMTNNKRADKHNEHTQLSTMEEKEALRRELSYQYQVKVDDVFSKMQKDKDHKNYGKRLFFGTHDRSKNDFHENEVNAVFDRLSKLHTEMYSKHYKEALAMAKKGDFDNIPDYFNFDDLDTTGLDPYAIEIVKEQYNTYNKMAAEDFRLNVDGAIHPKMLQFSSPKPRIFKSELLENFFSSSGDEIFVKSEMTSLIDKAISEQQPWLSEAKIKKGEHKGRKLSTVIAEGYTLGLMNKAYGIDGMANGELRVAMENGNLDKFIQQLTSETERTGYNSATTSSAIKEAYESYKNRIEKELGSKGVERYTHRMVLDESVTHTMKNGKEIAIRDFTENNTEMLLKTEIERGSGRIAAAKNGITNLRTYTDKMKRMLQVENRIRDNVMSEKDIELYNEIMENFYREMNGQSYYAINTNTQQFLRFMRNWQIAVSMGRLFLSQMFEFSKAISYSSMGDVMKNIPAIMDYRDSLLMFREEKYSESFKDGMAQHVMEDLSMGHLQKQTIQVLGYEPDYAAGNYKKDGSEQNKANKFMDKAVHWSMKWNNQFDSKLRLIAAMSQISQLQRYAKGDPKTRAKLRKGMYSDKRLNLENFDINDIDEIADLMNKHGREANGRFQGFSFEKMNDTELRTFKKYTDYLNKMAKRVVVDKDFSNLPALQFNPLYKTVMQFRDHGIASLTEEATYNMKSGADAISAKFLTYGMGMGAMIYMTQVYLASLGREDKEEFLKENLTLDGIMLGGIYRMGFAHPPAAMLDTIVNWGLGRDAIFNFRMSGHATDIVEGTPIMAHLQGMLYFAQMSAGADLSPGQTQKAINIFISNHLGAGEARKYLNYNVIHNNEGENE